MPDTGSKPLAVRVLGPLDVRWHGELVDLGGPRPRSIFATLALNVGQVVPVDRLHDRAWGGYSGPPSARSNLKTYISRMRRQLPEGAIRHSHGGYVLDADLAELDSRLFETGLAEARKRADAADFDSALVAVTEALALWHGPVLDGVALQGEGIDVDEIRLDELRLEAEMFRMEVLFALGRPAAAVTELIGLTRAHPLKEEFWELYMLGLYRSGRSAEALRAFQTCRRVLGEEVGIEPNPDLQALERAILRNDPNIMAGGRDLGLRGVRVLDRQLGGLAETAARARQIVRELREQAHAAHRAGANWRKIAQAVGLDLEEAVVGADKTWEELAALDEEAELALVEQAVYLWDERDAGSATSSEAASTGATRRRRTDTRSRRRKRGQL